MWFLPNLIALPSHEQEIGVEERLNVQSAAVNDHRDFDCLVFSCGAVPIDGQDDVVVFGVVNQHREIGDQVNLRIEANQEVGDIEHVAVLDQVVLHCVALPAANQKVIAIETCDIVTSRVGFDGVVAYAREDIVVPGTTDYLVVAISGLDPVMACACDDHIVAGTAKDTVVPVTGLDDIATVTSKNRVVTLAGENLVISGSGVDKISASGIYERPAGVIVGMNPSLE